MSSTSRLSTLFTSALTLVALQIFVPSLSPTPAEPAQARPSVKYQPPNRNAPQRTDGTGVRSSTGFRCPTSENSLFIAALAPTSHTGDTIAPRPTLYTYFSGTEPIEVKLREIGTITNVWKQTLQAPASGFAAIAYPSDAPELQTGKTYQWSVEVVCNSNKRSQNKGYTVARIQRVAEPVPLKDDLAKATTAIDRAQVYANQSLWYEALDSLASASLAAPTDLALRNQLIDLLEQGGLVKAAKEAREANGKSTSRKNFDRPAIGPSPAPRASHCHSYEPMVPKSDRTRCP
jgi:Domain of Unknown Function (DUF928)